MPSFKRSKNVRPEFQKQPGDRVNVYNGTYVAYVKDNRDVQKMGRLKVWVPDFGGDPKDPNAWIVASYASPFAGATPVKFNEKDLKEYNNSQTSYGFWMIPPDVDNQVLIVFANGDSTRCFWFACIYNNFMNQQVPGIAASDSEEHYGPETTTDDCPLPTGEYNKYSTGRKNIKPDEEKKPVQPYVSEGLREQGLIFDEIRGVTDSTARRESPSKVFGLSTPGPHAETDEDGREGNPYDGRGYDNPKKLITRKGGHQIIFDDHEEHEHIKLRTRSGSELLLDETNGIVYFTNRDGSSWVEMSESGHFDFYSKHSMSGRTEKDFNIRADRDINIEAGRNINFKSAKDYVEDRASFLEGYANTQQKELIECFDEKTKKEYIKDFPEIDKKFKEGKLSVDQAFKNALKEEGLPTTSEPTNLYGINQDEGAKTSLSSIQLLSLLRGSHIVGEGFGDEGNLYFQAIGDMNFSALDNSFITAENGNLNLFAGENVTETAGLSLNYMAGLGYTVTAGTSANISSGLDTKIHAGAEFHLGAMNDAFFHFRADVTALLEGENLNIEAQPVWFEGDAREIFQARPHRTKIKLQDYNFEAERIRTTVQPWEGSATFPTGMSTYEITVGGETPGLLTVNVPSGNIDFSGGTFDVQAGLTQLSNSIVTLAQVVDPEQTPVPIIVPATPASVNNYYPESGEVPEEGLPWAQRPGTAATAELAETPMIYAKVNVIPKLKREGNKEYCISYHTHVVETISRRFMTHEPCVEHENTGNNEEKYEDFKNNLRFRIVD